MVEELESESSVEECVWVWCDCRWLEEPPEGNSAVWCRLEGPLVGDGASAGNVRLEDSYDLGRFRLSRALSRSSNRAISSKALILALSSFSS